MIRSFCITVVVTTLAALGGCGKSDGDQFLGKFENPARKESVEVTKNGDSYLLAATHPNAWVSGETKTDKFPATYQNGVLQIAGGVGQVNIGYDKAHDALLMPTMGSGSVELARVK
jgi:hypothetical protein